MDIQMWVAFAALLFTVTMALLTGAFFMGRLSQRVTGLEGQIKKESGTHDSVIVLETQMVTCLERLASLQRSAEGTQRQLANLMGKRGGEIQELGSAG